MNETPSATYRFLYLSTKTHPKVIRLRVRMRDQIDPDALEAAVETTMRRFPYYAVALRRDGDRFVFEPNDRPVRVLRASDAFALNAPETNGHLIAFSWADDRIVLDVFHGLTDGTGAYEIMRTLLYYYCSLRYGRTLPPEGVRLLGDPIPDEEWADPVLKLPALPVPAPKRLSDALSLVHAAGLEQDRVPTVYSVAIPEAEFMRFTAAHDGSPGTMTALFLSRAVAGLYPDRRQVIRVSLCVNQRPALGAPAAHGCHVGAAMLEYKDRLRDWPLDRQATAFRGMVFAQTLEERVLGGVAAQTALAKRFIAAKTDGERLALARAVSENTVRVQTATVSYVGRANYRDAERYIRDFRTWTIAETPMLVEISAVNGRFVLDFIQHFSSPVYLNAFLAELEGCGVSFDLQDAQPLSLPAVRLPWSGSDGGKI